MGVSESPLAWNQKILALLLITWKTLDKLQTPLALISSNTRWWGWTTSSLRVLPVTKSCDRPHSKKQQTVERRVSTQRTTWRLHNCLPPIVCLVSTSINLRKTERDSNSSAQNPIMHPKPGVRSSGSDHLYRLPPALWIYHFWVSCTFVITLHKHR